MSVSVPFRLHRCKPPIIPSTCAGCGPSTLQSSRKCLSGSSWRFYELLKTKSSQAVLCWVTVSSPTDLPVGYQKSWLSQEILECLSNVRKHCPAPAIATVHTTILCTHPPCFSPQIHLSARQTIPIVTNSAHTCTPKSKPYGSSTNTALAHPCQTPLKLKAASTPNHLPINRLPGE